MALKLLFLTLNACVAAELRVTPWSTLDALTDVTATQEAAGVAPSRSTYVALLLPRSLSSVATELEAALAAGDSSASPPATVNDTDQAVRNAWRAAAIVKEAAVQAGVDAHVTVLPPVASHVERMLVIVRTQRYGAVRYTHLLDAQALARFIQLCMHVAPPVARVWNKPTGRATRSGRSLVASEVDAADALQAPVLVLAFPVDPEASAADAASDDRACECTTSCADGACVCARVRVDACMRTCTAPSCDWAQNALFTIADIYDSDEPAPAGARLGRLAVGVRECAAEGEEGEAERDGADDAVCDRFRAQGTREAQLLLYTGREWVHLSSLHPSGGALTPGSLESAVAEALRGEDAQRQVHEVAVDAVGGVSAATSSHDASTAPDDACGCAALADRLRALELRVAALER